MRQGLHYGRMICQPGDNVNIHTNVSEGLTRSWRAAQQAGNLLFFVHPADVGEGTDWCLSPAREAA